MNVSITERLMLATVCTYSGQPISVVKVSYIDQPESSTDDDHWHFAHQV